MSRKPTLVFVPGAWHTAEAWGKVTSILEAQEYNCISVTLPSTKGDVSVSFGDDIKAVQDPAKAEMAKGNDVIIVVHSYGGAVGQSAVKGLTRPKGDTTSSEDSEFGHVIGLVFIGSGFGQTGVSFIDGLGGKPPPFWIIDPSGFAVIIAPARELFYHDLPEEEGDYWVNKLTKQALEPFMEGGEDAYAGWMDVPVWLLETVDDKAFPIEAQRMLVQIGKDAGGDITTREIFTSHSPMLSKPKETVDFILEAVTAIVG